MQKTAALEIDVEMNFSDLLIDYWKQFDFPENRKIQSTHKLLVSNCGHSKCIYADHEWSRFLKHRSIPHVLSAWVDEKIWGLWWTKTSTKKRWKPRSASRTAVSARENMGDLHLVNDGFVRNDTETLGRSSFLLFIFSGSLFFYFSCRGMRMKSFYN